MNSLRLAKCMFSFRFTEITYLPLFMGNTLRGALGASLEKTGSSIYINIFKVSSVESIPNPYAISVPYPGKEKYEKGDCLNFHVTLFGYACDYTDELIQAVKGMNLGKLTNSECIDAQLVLSDNWSDEGAASIPKCEYLIVEFLSPTEILKNKSTVLKPGFSDFIDSLFGRVSGIIDNYTDEFFVLPYSYIVKKPNITAEYDLKNVSLKTGGQPINGFVGTVLYIGDVTRYLPYIDLGCLLHVGKKTTRSCGEYRFFLE